VGIAAEGFAKANFKAYSRGEMVFLSINDKANKGKRKKY